MSHDETVEQGAQQKTHQISAGRAKKRAKTTLPSGENWRARGA